MDSASRSTRGVWLPYVVSLGVAVVVLVGVWLRALQTSADGVTTATGARSGLLAIAVAALIVVAVRGAKVRAFRFLWIVPVVVGAGFISIASILFGLGRLDTAFALYGGLQVSRSDKMFSDMHWVMSWFSCDFCSEWDPHYGPSLAWLDPLTQGNLGLDVLMPLGLASTVLSLLAFAVLARSSATGVQWVLVIAGVSPAWLLLLDRANSDALVLASVVLGGWAVCRYPSLMTWSCFALFIWLLGTVKFYPFALGVVLLFALSIRRGWVLLVTFAAGTAAYMWLAWSWYERSSAWTLRSELLDERLPAYGRVLVEQAIVGGTEPNQALRLGVSALLVALVTAAGWFGFRLVKYAQPARSTTFFGVLALGGSVAFFGKVLWAGFGFLYSGAFLLLVLPVLATSSRRAYGLSGEGTTISGLLASTLWIAVVALFTPANAIVATVAGLLVAGVGLGASMRILQITFSSESVGSTCEEAAR